MYSTVASPLHSYAVWYEEYFLFSYQQNMYSLDMVAESYMYVRGPKSLPSFLTQSYNANCPRHVHVDCLDCINKCLLRKQAHVYMHKEASEKGGSVL